MSYKCVSTNVKFFALSIQINTSFTCTNFLIFFNFQKPNSKIINKIVNSINISKTAIDFYEWKRTLFKWLPRFALQYSRSTHFLYSFDCLGLDLPKDSVDIVFLSFGIKNSRALPWSSLIVTEVPCSFSKTTKDYPAAIPRTTPYSHSLWLHRHLLEDVWIFRFPNATIR